MTQQEQVDIFHERLRKLGACLEFSRDKGETQTVVGRFPICGSKFDGRFFRDENVVRYLLGFDDELKR